MNPGRERTAAIYTLIETAKLNMSTRRLGSPTSFRIAEHPAKRIDDPLPWNWCAARPA